jgi:hypothetical protein
LIKLSLLWAIWLLGVEREWCLFCLLSHSFANMRDLRGRCFMKLAMLTATSRTCFKSSPLVFQTRTSRWRKQWVVMSSWFFLWRV